MAAHGKTSVSESPSWSSTRYCSEFGFKPTPSSLTTTLMRSGLSAPEDPSTACEPSELGANSNWACLATVGRVPVRPMLHEETGVGDRVEGRDGLVEYRARVHADRGRRRVEPDRLDLRRH